jgi:hypothetical protein
MSVKKIQIAQLGKNLETSESCLVAYVYTEAPSTTVVLRKSGAEDKNHTD